MSRTIHSKALITALVGTVVGVACAQDAALEKAALNKEAPAFELPSLDGEAVALAAQRGKYVVLEWTNYDCPFVKKHYETGRMPALQKKMAEDGVVWYTVCSSAPGKQGHFTKEQWEERMKAVEAAPAAVLLDTDGKVGKAYDARNTPHMVVINPEGTVIYLGAYDDQPGLERAIMDKAVNYVVQALDEAKAGKPVSVPAVPAYGCTVKY